MTHEKMLDFVHKQTKLALEKIPHFDGGGEATTTGGPLGSINSSLGLQNNFSAQSADIQNGTDVGQLNTAYNGAQSGLTQQQDLANQLQPGGQQGTNAQASLSTQLQGQANGVGPNVATAELNQATGQNIQNQAALMASNRGASSNPGEVARLAAEQGAATQQQSAGQAATLQAQQQVAAQQGLANLSAEQVSQQGQAVTGVNQTQQGEQSILQNANTSANNANVAMQENINTTNAETAAANANMSANTFGGLTSAGSSILSALAKGGMVKKPTKFGNGGPVAVGGAMTSKPGTGGFMAKGGNVGKYASGGQANDVQDNLGSFQPVASSASNGPGAGAPTALPANNSTGFFLSASGGGGGGGGGGGLAGLAALMAKGGMMMAGGGQLPGNQLTGGFTSNGGGTKSFVGQWLNAPSSASNGPGSGGGGSLPQGEAADLSTSGSQLGSAIGTKINNYKADSEVSDDIQDADDLQQPEMGSQLSGPSPSLGADTNMSSSMAGDSMPSASDLSLARGGKIKKLASKGGGVKADNKKEKAVKADNSYDNDKIPAMLSEGEIVLPRSVTQHPMAPDRAKAFVAHVLAKKMAGHFSK